MPGRYLGGVACKTMVELWRREYNRVRPHSALGYGPPAPETVATPPVEDTADHRAWSFLWGQVRRRLHGRNHRRTGMKLRMAQFASLALAAAFVVACGGGAAACPEPGSGHLLLEREDKGYCLVYPNTFTAVDPNPDETALVIGDLLNHTDARLSITVADAAGKTTQGAADKIESDYAIPGFDVGREDIDIGGEDAVLFQQMPGQDFTRRIIVVKDDRLYVLDFTPADEAVGDPYTRMQALLDTVVDSFTFK
jgi:hypothetical protein